MMRRMMINPVYCAILGVVANCSCYYCFCCSFLCLSNSIVIAVIAIEFVAFRTSQRPFQMVLIVQNERKFIIITHTRLLKYTRSLASLLARLRRQPNEGFEQRINHSNPMQQYCSRVYRLSICARIHQLKR